MKAVQRDTCIYIGEQLAQYHFGEAHPFGPDRHNAFVSEFEHLNLRNMVDVLSPVIATEDELALFHTQDYLERVKQTSITGEGYLDGGDTPAMPGMYDIARYVCGTTLDGVRRVMKKEYRRGFTPIGGLHHARRHSAAGFCVFNDCGIAIEILKQEFGLSKVAYVDIDAHHGDGVYYSFIDDPTLVFCDLHEDGRFLYPGTGAADETGMGAGQGSKLNLPLPMNAGDDEFLSAWDKVEEFLMKWQPEFILLQCGADSIAGDPITHMQYSFMPHRHAAERLCQLADKMCDGRIFAMGGGGYNLNNLAKGWNAVVSAFAEHKR